MMEIKKVLVTGATGTIGRDLCHRLGGSFEVYAGVRREVEGLPNPVMCNLREFDSVLAAMQGMDAVIHLAAQSWEEDVRTRMIPDNITGCYNLFEAAHQVGVKRVVFASSNHVVGLYLDEGVQVDENVPVRPDTFYAVTKVFGEALGRYYAEVYGLSVISARIGWFLSPDRLVARSESALKWLNQSRTLWISPRDTAQFMIRCLKVGGITYDVFNCVSNNTRGLLDLAHAREVLGYVPEDDAEPLLRAAGLVKEEDE